MTFKKIDDYKRRDELVQEHLRLKDDVKYIPRAKVSSIFYIYMSPPCKRLNSLV